MAIYEFVLLLLFASMHLELAVAQTFPPTSLHGVFLGKVANQKMGLTSSKSMNDSKTTCYELEIKLRMLHKKKSKAI